MLVSLSFSSNWNSAHSLEHNGGSNNTNSTSRSEEMVEIFPLHSPHLFSTSFLANILIRMDIGLLHMQNRIVFTGNFGVFIDLYIDGQHDTCNVLATTLLHILRKMTKVMIYLYHVQRGKTRCGIFQCKICYIVAAKTWPRRTSFSTL